MTAGLQEFGNTAKSLARNPLGIIALFIVLVYGFAAIVTGFGGSLSVQERLPLIYFMIIFPVLVLAVFTWLVSNHSGKLFAPSDFKDESNYVKMQMSAVASLTAAASKGTSEASEEQLNKIVEMVQSARPNVTSKRDKWRNRILWVDDRPENNIFERQAFEALGITFTLALSTKEAIQKLGEKKYAAIISDMGRREGPREGYVLLDLLRAEGDNTPLFFYSSSNDPEHTREALAHGAQGNTNHPQVLFDMVTRAVIQGRDE